MNSTKNRFATSFGKALLSALVAIAGLEATTVSSAEWFVATNGNNAAAGTIDGPWADIRYGVIRMARGDTLNIREGTYTDDGHMISDFKSGLSASEPTVIQAYANERVVYHPTHAAPNGHAILVTGDSNIVFNGLEINADEMAYTGLKLTAGASFVTVTNCVIRDCKEGHGILITPLDAGSEATGHLITHCKIYNNGWAPRLDSSPLHQLYTQTSSNIIEHCLFGGLTNFLGGGYGIHSYMEGGHNCIYRNNVFTNCHDAAIGLVGSSSRNFYVYNNILRNNPGYAIRLLKGTDIFIINNTCVSNGANIRLESSTNVWIENNIAIAGRGGNPGGIYVSPDSEGVVVRNNLAYANSYSDYRVVGSPNLTIESNLFRVTDIGGIKLTNAASFDVKFHNLAIGDVRVRPGSDAIGKGRRQQLFSKDVNGTERGDGDWTIGAWHYRSGIPIAPTNLTVIKRP